MAFFRCFRLSHRADPTKVRGLGQETDPRIPLSNKLGVSTIWSNQSDASGSKFTNVGMVPGPGQRKLEMELGGEPDKSALLDLHRHFRVDRATSKLVKID
jgi:hypothetical protein